MIFLFPFFCFQTNAQTFGIKGGINLANMLVKDDNKNYGNDYSLRPGFNVGVNVNAPFNDFLSFESGLFITTKGTKYEYEDEITGADVTAKTDLFYLDIPLTFKASHDLGDGLKIFGAIGPYVGIGLSGKARYTVKYQREEETGEEDIKWGSDDEDDFRRLDIGLSFGGGVEINSFMTGISYDLGLSNISVYQDNGSTIKNSVLKFSVGYRFGN
jgi:hypothetical protein